MHMMPSKPSRAVVSLIWNSSGALVIPKGRRSHLYLPYDVCMVVIESSSRGMWRKPSFTSAREKHFAALSLWSCSVMVGIWCFGRWMALFTVWLGSIHTLNFFGVSRISFFGAPGGWFVYLGNNPLFNVMIQGLFFTLALRYWYSVNWHRVVCSHLFENEQVDQAHQGLRRCQRTGLECPPYVTGQEVEAVGLIELWLALTVKVKDYMGWLWPHGVAEDDCR